jgi:non-lysosomal glucosylceramidase
MSSSGCDDPGCGCGPRLPRRQFLKLAGAVSLGTALGGSRAFAGPFQKADFLATSPEVPLDKKLDPRWIQSLFERGTPKEYRGDALRHIGMPVGGVCAGMVYLGGDGKLWHWDIFNQNKTGVTQAPVAYQGRQLDAVGGAAYVQPIPNTSEIHQGFWLEVDGVRRPLEIGGWSDIRFIGQYPIGNVSYADPSTQVKARVQAFSPFIPLNEEESGLPVTLMKYRITNLGDRSVEIELGGFLGNPIGMYTTLDAEIERTSENLAAKDLAALVIRANAAHRAETSAPDIPLESWSSATYVGWTAKGTAFGTGPILRKDVPEYQGELGGPGDRVVNSHASAPGHDVGARDGATGKLTGPAFTIERTFLHFWIGGGDHPGETCLNLVVDGKVVRSATGANSNQMHLASFSIQEFRGMSGHLEIVDMATGPWGHIGVGQIWQSDRSENSVPLNKRADFGTMALGVFGPGKVDREAVVNDKTVGQVSVQRRISAGDSYDVTLAVAWHFPNLSLGIADDSSGRYYGQRFSDAGEVLRYVAKNLRRLVDETLRWTETWYDSTLPYWFLDRTFANTSTLATTTAHRFGTGRFYAWEGVGCCAGTCTHVWHYAQAMGRLFPAFERDLRERVDYGVGFHANDGSIGFRAEFDMTAAVDGQAGTILRTYREHQMSADSAFLGRVWPRAKQATQYLIGLDAQLDGLLAGPQENTLDAAWYGKIAWTSSLYNAALRAASAMAREMGDREFADRCGVLADRGKRSIQSQLFNGEYFIQVRDPEHAGALGTYDACHIDQVMGQGWAWQTGLPRVLDRDKTVSALKALYKYNFTPDVGPFRKSHPEGRWYAEAGDGGMIMVTNPGGNADPYGDSKAWQFGYFNECMSGFEHQVASHMIGEGLVMEGLAVTRAIHDRYSAELRNPYNEIECSDHYARAMASYGSFVTMCGFEFHGPSGTIGFSPRITPERFRAAFTAAEGWGTYEQRQNGGQFEARVEVKWGQLRVQTIKVAPGLTAVGDVEVRHRGRAVPSNWSIDDGRLAVRLDEPVVVQVGSEVEILVTP